MPDPSRLRARATAHPPWGVGRQLRTPAPGSDRALDRVRTEGTTLLSGGPWSGRTTALAGVGRQWVLDGLPPDRVGWVDAGHPMWADVSLEDLIVAFAADGRPAALLVDDPPLEGIPVLTRARGPLRVVATPSAAVPGAIALPPWTFTRAVAASGAGPRVAPCPSPDALVEQAFRLHDAADPLREPLRRYLVAGAFPALGSGGEPDLVAFSTAAQRLHRACVLDTTLYRRIPRDFGVREPWLLDRLLTDLGAFPGSVLSPTTAAAALGVTQPTLDKHLAALEASGLVVQLPAWSPDGRARGRRVLLADPALRAVTRGLGARALTDPEEMAHLLLHALVGHAVGWGRSQGIPIGHWRSGRHEVDLVFDHPTAPMALQIDASRRSAFDGLYALSAADPRFEGRTWVLLHRVPPTHPRHHPTGVGRLPTLPFLLALGA